MDNFHFDGIGANIDLESGIINGVGDNKFAPKNTTKAEEAISYANATREQAIIIATRLVKNSK